MRTLILALIVVTACAWGEASRAGGAAGLATVIDSTGDSVVARVTGEVPAGAVRTLTEEMRIAPGVDDTTLFTEISTFKVDRSGRTWVFDQPSKSFFVFAANGTLLRHVGREGAGPGEFRQANGIVFLGDTGVAVWDGSNARISFLDSTGTFVTSWVTPSGFYTSDGLITDRSGALFLKRPVTAPREDEILGRIGLVRLEPGGAFGDSLAPPELAVSHEPYVARSGPGKNRSSSSMSSTFAPSYSWAWHPEGHFVVAHGGRYEIILARPAGKPLVIKRDAGGVPVAAEERDEERARILYQMRRVDPSWSWTGPPIPETKAPLASVLIARDGRIWARVPAASERIPEADMPVVRDSQAPVYHFRTPVVYEVFSSDGRFLGRVDFPARTRFMEADGDFVWAIQRGESDLPAVVRFRITPGLQ